VCVCVCACVCVCVRVCVCVCWCHDRRPPQQDTHVPKGFSWRRRHYLHIEEAVFYIDRGDLLLFVDVDLQQRLLSVQEAYDLMVRVVLEGLGL
jgi:hypothetical protein